MERSFDLSTSGTVIITGIGRTGVNPPVVNWQRTGAGSSSDTSKIGVESANATLPSNFTIADGETAIVAEVYFAFEPLIFPKVVFAETFYHRAFFRPRLAPLDVVEAG